MNNVYPSIVDAFLTGTIDITSAPLRCQLVGGYTFDPFDLVFADITGAIDSPVTVTVTAVADGTVFADPVTFPAVPTGDTVTGLVFYIDDGALPLVCFIDRRADTVPLSVATNDGDLVFPFPRLFRL